MAYFPNGTSGDIYLEQWCFRCKNWKCRPKDTAEGCPIWDAHILANYDAVNNKGARDVLNYLIPMDEQGIYPLECRMFDWNGEYQGQITFDTITADS